MYNYGDLDAQNEIVRLSKALQPLIVKIDKDAARFAEHICKTLDSMEDNSNEGGTATTPGRKANFFRIARDSGGELQGQIRRAERRGYITKEERIEVGLILNKCVFLLNRLVKKWEGVDDNSQNTRHQPQLPK